MPSRVRSFSGDAIEKRIKKGHGQGEGADYLPWFFVTEIPSEGTSAVVKGDPFNRDRHFPSQNEVGYYYAATWSKQIVDFREQYPLLPIDDTLEIADALRFKHPTDKKGQPVVMTTDALLTIARNGDLHAAVRTVKEIKDLWNPRTLEKLEIERQYFLLHGIDDWGIVTDIELAQVRKEIQGIKSLDKARNLNSLAPMKLDQIRTIAATMSGRVKAVGYVRLPALCAGLDHKFAAEAGSCLAVAKYLIANKAWQTDLTLLCDLTQPIAYQVRNLDFLWR
jgi:hypothetical protein